MADTHLHPRGGAASKGRCQWLIWNRCDRLIMLHSGKAALPGEQRTDQEGGGRGLKVGAADSPFFLFLLVLRWATRSFRLKLTV